MENGDDLELVDVDGVQDNGRNSQSPDNAEESPTERTAEERETNRNVSSGDHSKNIAVVDNAEDMFSEIFRGEGVINARDREEDNCEGRVKTASDDGERSFGF